jgi:hypothetical protein
MPAGQLLHGRQRGAVLVRLGRLLVPGRRRIGDGLAVRRGQLWNERGSVHVLIQRVRRRVYVRSGELLPSCVFVKCGRRVHARVLMRGARGSPCFMCLGGILLPRWLRELNRRVLRRRILRPCGLIRHLVLRGRLHNDRGQLLPSWEHNADRNPVSGRLRLCDNGRPRPLRGTGLLLSCGLRERDGCSVWNRLLRPGGRVHKFCVRGRLHTDHGQLLSSWEHNCHGSSVSCWIFLCDNGRPRPLRLGGLFLPCRLCESKRHGLCCWLLRSCGIIHHLFLRGRLHTDHGQLLSSWEHNCHGSSVSCWIFLCDNGRPSALHDVGVLVRSRVCLRHRCVAPRVVVFARRRMVWGLGLGRVAARARLRA